MSYQKLDLVQGSKEWLDARLEHFTASRAGVIDNVYPYQTALQYATELLTRKTKDESEGKEALFAHGHAVEKAAREWVRSNLNMDLKPIVVVSNDLPCLLASLDGGDEEKGFLFEAKYIGRDAFEDALKGVLKPHHEYQVQAQLLATGFDKAIYFAMDPDGRAAAVDLVAKPDMQARLKEGIGKFWADLKDGKLPEACDRDVFQVEDPQLSMLAEMDFKLSALKREYDALEEIVLARYSDKTRVQGGGVSITRYWAKGNVDYAKVPQLKGVDMERFRKAGSMRTKVTIKKGA